MTKLDRWLMGIAVVLLLVDTTLVTILIMTHHK